MQYEFDPIKDQSNQDKHGLSLSDASAFEWDTASIEQDNRNNYGEQRFEATGLIGDRLYVMVFCRRGTAVRVISLRKANPREVKKYADQN